MVRVRVRPLVRKRATVTDATHNLASAEGLGLARIILFIILIYTLTKQ